MGTTRTPFFLLIAGTIFAGIGNGIAMVALPWLVLDRTGSATNAALVAAAASVPLLFASLLSGTVVDRIGRKTTSIASDALSALSVIAIPVLDSSVGLTVILLAVCATLGAFFDPAGITARQTMLPDSAVAAGWRLNRVNSLYEAAFSVAYLVGPGLGGLLIATIGASATLWFAGAGFGLSIIAIGAMRMVGTGRVVVEADSGGFWANTKSGVQFLWREHVLRTMALITMVAVALYLPVQGVILPTFYTATQTPEHLGWVLTVMSAGGVVRALAYGQWADRFSRRNVFIWSMISFAATMIGMALLPSLPMMLVVSAIMGATYGPIGPIANYVMQTRTPAHVQGRVIGAKASLSYAAGPLGYLVIGPLIDQIGLQATFVTLAVLTATVPIWSIRSAALRDLDRTCGSVHAMANVQAQASTRSQTRSRTQKAAKPIGTAEVTG